MDTTTKKTIILFSGDLDKVMAAFIIANGAVAFRPARHHVFHLLGAQHPSEGRVGEGSAEGRLVEKMFGWMMPKGPNKLSLQDEHSSASAPG